MRTLILKLFLVMLAIVAVAELIRYNAALYNVQVPDGFILAILAIGFVMGLVAFALFNT